MKAQTLFVANNLHSQEERRGGEWGRGGRQSTTGNIEYLLDKKLVRTSHMILSQVSTVNFNCYQEIILTVLARLIFSSANWRDLIKTLFCNLHINLVI